MNDDKIISKLNTPKKVQDFLDDIPFNFEKRGQTYMPPKKTLKLRRVQCFEAAALACLCLERHNIENYLMDLKTKDLKKDSDHVLCLFKIRGFWGAISKTNHSVLRWRDPIYRTPRELAMSYYHEYFLDSGEKTLLSFSKPFDVWKKFGKEWAEGEEELDDIAKALDDSPHTPFVPRAARRLIRKAGRTEIRGAAVTQYKK